MKKLEIKNILVPIDLSRMSIQGIETAKRLGRRFGATNIPIVPRPSYVIGKFLALALIFAGVLLLLFLPPLFAGADLRMMVPLICKPFCSPPPFSPRVSSRTIARRRSSSA